MVKISLRLYLKLMYLVKVGGFRNKLEGEHVVKQASKTARGHVIYNLPSEHLVYRLSDYK